MIANMSLNPVRSFQSSQIFISKIVSMITIESQHHQQLSLNICFYTSKLVYHDSHHHHDHDHDHDQMTSMLKIENMASTAGREAEGVKENLVMRMMMRLLVRMKMMTMREIMMIMRMRLTIISVMR